MKRKVVVELVDSGKVNNHRLIEYFARKINERSVESAK